VRRLITGKDDVASLQQQLVALKAEGADASVEIERLKSERVAAVNYEEATAIDGAVARQAWIVEHCAAALPELELRLAACRAADQAAALARHKAALIDCYPKLKRAILFAVAEQQIALQLRDAACKEIGEAAVARNLPSLAYAGFLMPDLVAIWQTENDRVFADLARKPRPAAVPAPVRAALPAPTKSKAPVAVKEPAPRPKRVVRHDAFPTDGQQRLVVFLRAGSELEDGTVAGIGDEVALPAEQARALILRGCCDYVTKTVEKGQGR